MRDDVPDIGPRGRETSQSLARGLAVLEALASDTVQERGIRELSRSLGLNKSIVQRLVRTLTELRFVDQNPATGKYRIGPRALEIGHFYLLGTGLHEAALPALRRLTVEDKLNAVLGVLDGRDVVYLLAFPSVGPIVLRSAPGARMPAHATAVGKALLAGLSDSQLTGLLEAAPLPQVNPRTVTDVEAIRRELDRVRREGYSLSDGESVPGVFAVGAPVRDRNGQVVAAISGARPRYLIGDESIPDIIRAVSETAADISSSLGAPISRLAERPAVGAP